MQLSIKGESISIYGVVVRVQILKIAIYFEVTKVGEENWESVQNEI